MKKLDEIRLFLSSPNDVESERKKAQEIVNRVNKGISPIYNVHFNVLDWKTHVLHQIGPRAQEVINRQINDYDIFLGIMWKRFGTKTGKAASGTEEEFNNAYANWKKYNRPHILFYFSKMPYMPQNSDEAKQWVKVIDFKEKLNKSGLVTEYDSLEKFGETLYDHMVMFLRSRFQQQHGTDEIADFSRYIKYLRDESMYIDIRGLSTGKGKVHQFRIDQLYIPLKTTGLRHDKGSGKKTAIEQENLTQESLLQEALKSKRLMIRGEPGAGKTTFLRLLAFLLCEKWLGSMASLKVIDLPDTPPLPIYLRVGELTEYLRTCREKKIKDVPPQDDSPECLLRFLQQQNADYHWRLPADAFEKEMNAGHCTILLDGLDEAPDLKVRETIARLAGRLMQAFPDCHVVVTSRPAALTDEIIPMQFDLVDIAALDDKAIDQFLMRWTGELYADTTEKPKQYYNQLKQALYARPEIRRMAKTPVMLTALAVVHWNENQLPEQRAELYESIIRWLLRSRKDRPGRQKAERCRKLLQKLALAMFQHPEGRQKQAGFAWAAQALAGEFVSAPDRTAQQAAEYFLRDEIVDSGIIAERSKRIEFWHLTFQEYLCACEIAGLVEQEQNKVIFTKNRLYSSEWREVWLLLAGVLYDQGEEKINHFIDAAIAHGPKESNHKTLPDLARMAGLLGSMVHDLSPFDFKPAHVRYIDIMHSVDGIFDKNLFHFIPVQVRVEAADALGQAGDNRLENIQWVKIAGGRFWMGAQKESKNDRNYDKDAYDREKPVHEVMLSSFDMSKYPITVGQFVKFMEDGGYEDARYWQAGGFNELKEPHNWNDQLPYPSRPVVFVSWFEAAAYAAWAGALLPTEAQWERAARGPGEEYRKYPWDSKEPIADTANFIKSNINHATPVGIFPLDCSPEGIVDMAGNVLEWCQDGHDEKYYAQSVESKPMNNPSGPEKGEFRVLRGGSWSNDADGMRCSSRNRNGPRLRDLNVGFRVVRPVRS